jgi:putative membrane-bound dehydrogenase-like protein
MSYERLEVVEQRGCDARASTTFVVRIVAVAVLVAAGSVSPALASPVEPAEAAATLKTPDDLEATLFASEPLLTSPSDIDVDAAGRVWVCEVTNYRGRRDTRPEGDRILVLEDTDGDGKADKQVVFHQGRDVDSALGICVIGEGPGRKVIVSCAPNVFVFHDDDGDLVADRKQTLFTNTGDPQHDHSVHAFVVGPDGRWYFNFGNTGHQVCDANGTPIVDRFGITVNDSGKPYRQGMVFRCKPDGTDLEVLGHNFRNNYEVAVDSFGSLWQSDNDDDGNRGVRINAVLEFGNYGYVDERTGAGWRTPRTNLEKEVPLQHWHLNDPGVMPNLLQTGGGSPTGICFYEGDLLPSRFHGAIIHCDAGPNVVRGYMVTPRGAGYTAEITPIADGESDRWFRPSDVCVAPDGSLIVADWYDPGVGGHGMGDIDMGRIFRIAPPASVWEVPVYDFSTVAGCVSALASPNTCARATAVTRLAGNAEAAPALQAAFEQATDPRLKARYAWAAGMLPGQAAGWIERLANQDDDRLRAIALRLCRRVQGDVLGLVARFTADSSPLVRREAAIALRGESGPTADRLWGELAARHTAGDRWETEALGLGADSPAGFAEAGESLWDGRLAAWLSLVGDGWSSPAGREIVWRSRSSRTPELLGALLAEPSTNVSEALSLIRSLDFQDGALARAAVAAVLREPQVDRAEAGEWSSLVLPELVLRLERDDLADDALRKQVGLACDHTRGTGRFVDIVGRFGLADRVGELVEFASLAGTDDGVAGDAARVALSLGGADVVRRGILADDDGSARLLEAVGLRPDDACMQLLQSVVYDSDAPLARRASAIRGAAKSQRGCRSLIRQAQDGKLEGPLAEMAAAAISACPWGDIRGEAAGVLPMPKALGGAALPPVADLVNRSGNAEAGRAVFMGVGTCIKCHKVGDEGKMVGPELSGIGRKLSRAAFYEAILVPSAAISHNYETWTALSADGQTVSGLLISKTPTEVVIRAADGIDTTIKTDDLDELVKQPVSLMPADLAATMSADDLVNLVTWLETLNRN